MNLDLKQAIADLLAKAEMNNTLSDSGEVDELKEKAIRDYATTIGFYAESGPLFDPEGKYLCGRCCFRLLPKACDTVSGKISMQVGSCMQWRKGEPVGLKVKAKLTQIEAGYAERPTAKGFGCSRCEYGSEAKKADSKGRPSWCSFWGMHVTPFACCMHEDGKDLVEAPGE